MLGWVVDIVVGWIAGSIVLGLVFGVIGAFVGGEEVLTSVGVVAGTVLGIWWMRRNRARRTAA